MTAARLWMYAVRIAQLDVATVAAVCIVGAFVLFGCASVPGAPENRTTTTTVNVPVPVACIDPKDVPPLPVPTPIDVEHATPDQKAAAVAADAEAYQQYARFLGELLLKCSKTGGKR